jgi:hypothetical protein
MVCVSLPLEVLVERTAVEARLVMLRERSGRGMVAVPEAEVAISTEEFVGLRACWAGEGDDIPKFEIFPGATGKGLVARVFVGDGLSPEWMPSGEPIRAAKASVGPPP